MAKKKEISKEILDLKKGLAEGKAVVGAKTVLRDLKDDKLGKIYLASNCPKEIEEDIRHYSDLVKVPVIVLDVDNEEIGVLCKKHFFISVLGIKKR